MVVQRLRFYLSNVGSPVGSLVREIRPCMLHKAAKNKQIERICFCLEIGSIEILKSLYFHKPQKLNIFF